MNMHVSIPPDLSGADFRRRLEVVYNGNTILCLTTKPPFSIISVSPTKPYPVLLTLRQTSLQQLSQLRTTNNNPSLQVEVSIPYRTFHLHAGFSGHHCFIPTYPRLPKNPPQHPIISPTRPFRQQYTLFTTSLKPSRTGKPSFPLYPPNTTPSIPIHHLSPHLHSHPSQTPLSP